MFGVSPNFNNYKGNTMLNDTQKKEIFEQIKNRLIQINFNGRIYEPEISSFGRHMAILVEVKSTFSKTSFKLLIPNSKEIYI
jgi:hypothetical protein